MRAILNVKFKFMENKYQNNNEKVNEKSCNAIFYLG